MENTYRATFQRSLPMSDDDHYTKLTTKVKRGQGTRDQDTVKVVTRHPDPKEAVRRHEIAVAAARGFADNARAIQPEEDQTQTERSIRE